MIYPTMETDEDEDDDLETDEVEIKHEILEMMEKVGYQKRYMKETLMLNEHTYGTTGYHLLCQLSLNPDRHTPNNI